MHRSLSRRAIGGVALLLLAVAALAFVLAGSPHWAAADGAARSSRRHVAAAGARSSPKQVAATDSRPSLAHSAAGSPSSSSRSSRLSAAAVDDAVRRTLAEPAARVHLELTPPTGPRLTIAGVAGLATSDADLSLTVEGRAGGAGRIRIIGTQAWIGTPGLPWFPATADEVGASRATAWRDLLRQLRGDAGAPDGAALAGRPARVELDDRGRLQRVRARLPNSTFDLRLDGYDDDLAIVPPP